MLLSREAMALGLESGSSGPDRLREWTYEFDPAGFELLRRAIERVAMPACRHGRAPGSRGGGGMPSIPSPRRRAEVRHWRHASPAPLAHRPAALRPRGRRRGSRPAPAPAAGRRSPSRLAANLPGARRVVAKVNATRRQGEPSAQAGELAALELLHEIEHLLVERAAELQPGDVDGRDGRGGA